MKHRVSCKTTRCTFQQLGNDGDTPGSVEVSGSVAHFCTVTTFFNSFSDDLSRGNEL